MEIGSEEDDKEYRFYVKDNGVGIDPKYHQSIFDLFYRIQDLKTVEGTGVGFDHRASRLGNLWRPNLGRFREGQRDDILFRHTEEPLKRPQAIGPQFARREAEYDDEHEDENDLGELCLFGNGFESSKFVAALPVR